MTNPYVAEPAYNSEVYALPPFVSKRVDPVFQHITNKYYCQESVVSAGDQFTSLSWKIQQPDMNMVMRTVKVCIPVKIVVQDKNRAPLSPLLTDRLPACNLALSSNLQGAFTDVACTLNGKMFNIQPANYQNVLNKCFTSKDLMGFEDNHSLKPVACRNLKRNLQQAIPVPLMSPDGTPDPEGRYVTLADAQSAVSDHAFDISFTNGPFIERVRDFQTNLQGTTDYTADICFLLQVGPFMARSRKRSNVAVPYVKDFALRMLWNRSQSQFDVTNAAADVPQFPSRVICNGLLEFGTTVNLRNVGEAPLPPTGWAQGFHIQIVKKPFLEINYVKMGDLEPAYSLRCLEYRYQKSNQFGLKIPVVGSKLVSEPVLSRINTRLTSIPSRCYLWAELTDEYKRAFFMGNTSRFCRLENLHLRINQRTDVVNQPTQSELYEQFKRLTNNGLEYPAWAKSPVYCFDAGFLGQPDMLSGDGIVNTFEWDAEVVATELQCEELQMLDSDANLAAMGYKHVENYQFPLTSTHDTEPFTEFRYYRDFTPNAGAGAGGLGSILRYTGYNEWLSKTQSALCLMLTKPRYQVANAVEEYYSTTNSLAPSFYERYLANKSIRLSLLQRANQSTEIIRATRVLRKQYRFDGMYWGIIDTANWTLVINDTKWLWYVPESFLFEFDQQDVYMPVAHEQAEDPYGVDKQRKVVNLLGSINQATRLVTNPVIMTGHVTQPNAAGAVETVPFNRDFSLPFGPGPRAYPVTLGTGIHVDGFADGGGGNAVQGGLPIRAWGDGTQFGFQYIDHTNPTYRWAMFQPPANIVNAGNVNGMAIARSGVAGGYFNGAQVAQGNTIPCGFLQNQFALTIGQRVLTAGVERHIFTIGIDRALMGTQQIGFRVNYGLPAQNPANVANPNYANRGMLFKANEVAADNHLTDSLKFELKCLYEYGEQKYIFSQDGTPAKQLNNIILSASQDVSDPRLPSASQMNQKAITAKQGGITYLTQGGQQ